MIVISKALALARATDPLGPNNPVIGWRSIIELAGLGADSEAEGWPVTNLANTATYLQWRSASTESQVVEVAVATSEPVDYVAFARHNFGSTGVAVTIEAQVQAESAWETVAGPFLRAGDQPWIVRFEPRAVAAVRVRLEPQDEPPRIGVMYVGRALVLERRIYVGHTPLPFGRSANVQSGRSESGEFLGRVILNTQLASAVSLQNLTPRWYREELDPFIAAAKAVPFFWAWRPLQYPREVGFAWMTSDPQPVNARANGMMSVEWQMAGLTL